VSATTRALRQASRQRDQRLAELIDWLAVPSISTDPRYAGAITRAATMLERRLSEAGADVRLVRTAGAPVVVGHIAGPAGGPTVLVYGHYDVQAPGPGWHSPPFRPVWREGRLYVRGANDDKGQLYAWVAALGAWQAAGGMPCAVVVIADGDEEAGSRSVDRVLARLATRIRPDFVVASDTDAAPDGTPAITISQRGHAVLDIVIETGGVAVHSGRFGGAVVDPSDVLARTLVRMRAALMAAADCPPRPRAGAEWRRVSVPDADIERAAGQRVMTGAGLHRRIGTGPSMSVLSLRAGGPNAAGAIPTTATATIDLRVPAHWRIRPVVAQLCRLARTFPAATRNTRTIVRIKSLSDAESAIPHSDVLSALDRATCAAFGEPVRLIASGGSLPAAATLRRVFARTPVLLGLGASFSGAHGPDEYLDAAHWSRCVECLVHLLGAPPVNGNRTERPPTVDTSVARCSL
jgi:acetylornithine deacetylase/succinyl-diaminopimelate desuccinylase-like protein